MLLAGRHSGASRRTAWSATCRFQGSTSQAPEPGEKTAGVATKAAGAPAATEEVVTEAVAVPPSSTQLRMLCLASALPFVGFGFLDNSLMIVFGEFIDATLCVYFSFSTMAAAAIGNTISDVAAIFSGGAVEQMAMRYGVEEPPLSREQKQLAVTRVWQYTGQCVGIVVGCVLGCCPLLWLDPEAAHKLKMEKRQKQVFQHVVDRVADMLHAEAAMLLFVDKEKDDLFTANVTKNLRHTRWRKEDGFIGHAARTGKFVNVADVHDEIYYSPKLHDNFLGSGLGVKSMLCMPIWSDGTVVGVMVAINKQELHDVSTFTTRDEDVLAAISTHVAITITDSAGNFDNILDGCVKSVNKQGAPQWNPATLQRRRTLFDPVLKGMSNFLEVESTALMLLDEENEVLYTEAVEGSMPKHRGTYSESFAGWSAERGQVLNKTFVELQQDFEPTMYNDYQNSGINVRSVLCVPVFDTGRKCLGAFEIINKSNDREFSVDDVQFVQQVANYIALMLEGPTAELRRVLALTRQLHQHKQAMETSGQKKEEVVVCYLEQAQDLPSLGTKDDTLDSYVTFHIVRGDPLNDKDSHLQSRMLARRSVTTRQAVWEIGKSRTIFENRSPKWQETLAVPLPKKLEGAPAEELFLHVLIWGYGSIGQDKVLAQTSFPLSRMPRQAARGARPFPLQGIPGQELPHDLEKARIWLSFSRDWGSEPASAADAAEAPQPGALGLDGSEFAESVAV